MCRIANEKDVCYKHTRKLALDFETGFQLPKLLIKTITLLKCTLGFQAKFAIQKSLSESELNDVTLMSLFFLAPLK